MALGAISDAQSANISDWIRQAQERSGSVRAARSAAEARRAALSGIRSRPGPTLEVAPGLGLTNGNTVLSQELDVFGRRSAASRLAAAELRAAELEVARARATVSRELLASVAQWLASQEEVAGARLAAEAAGALQSAVAKQNEIGEAPRVHVTRAELEVLRANQLLVAAQGRQKSALAGIESLLGGPTELRAAAWPSVVPPAGANSLEVFVARAELANAQAESQVIRSDFAPTLAAGIATDVWSLDRNSWRSDNVGLQVFFRMPLFDRGQRKGAVQAANLEIEAARSRLAEAERITNLRYAEASAAYETARTIAATYQGDVLPKGEAMLAVMRDGYSAGLVTLIEVIEAQQTLVRLRQERIQAVLNLRLTEVNLWNAQLTLPGTEVPK